MTWSRKPSRRSVVPLKPGGSAMEKSSSPTSKKPFGSERGNPDWTPSEPLVPHEFETPSRPTASHTKGIRSMMTAKDVMKLIKDTEVKYVDFRFTDPRGKWQHVTFDVSLIEEETFAEGQMFDGSSIAGWKAIHESDMCLMPDPASAVIDPFYAETTLSLVCDVLEPTTGEPYNRDPRGIAKKAEGMVKSAGVGDTIFFGPEAEFFIFDDVKYAASPYNTGFKLDSVELPINSDRDYEGGNLGQHIGCKKGYFPVPPQDTAQDIRSEMLAAMARMGCIVEKHHHEVASAQHELGLKFSP